MKNRGVFDQGKESIKVLSASTALYDAKVLQCYQMRIAIYWLLIFGKKYITKGRKMV